MSLDLHVPDAFEVDSLCSARRERYVSKTLVKIATDSNKVVVRTLLLTNKTMYEFPVDAGIAAQIIGVAQPHLTQTNINADASTGSSPSLLSLPPLISLASTHIKEKPLTDIHSVSADPSDPSSFYLYFFSGSIGHRAAIGLNKLKSKLTHHSQFNHFLKRKRYTFASLHVCQRFRLLLSKLSLYQSQAMFERDSSTAGSIIPSPDYYQRHAFVFKNGQDRTLLLSNTHLFNVECTYKPLTVRSIKWVIHVQALTQLTLSHAAAHEVDGSRGEDVELVVSFDAARAAALMDSHHRSYKHGGQLQEKQWHFAFRSVSERAQFARTMQKVYHEQTAQPLYVLQQ